MLLAGLFRRVIRHGSLTVVDGHGVSHRFGDDSGQRLRIRLADWRTELSILRNPSLGAAEAFMDGRLVVEHGSLYDLLALFTRNLADTSPDWASRLRAVVGLMFRRFMQHNPIGRAQRNVAHHYDLSGKLYDLFLDSDRQYSCAYFPKPEASLEEAQHAKKLHLAAKLLIEPGHKVLDIGSGWGGLGLYLAREFDADVDGVTLSQEQHALSNQRAADAGLSDRARFHLRDYRDWDGPYDRIVSVGMFEHVGVGHYGEFFKKVNALLDRDGVAVIHTIGRTEGPGTTDPFIRRYIFPGGYIPALSEVMPAIERSGLVVTDVEVLRLHYAETLRAWRQRFMANRDQALELYDERFCRMWEFYLAGSEVSFRHMGMVVFQIQLARRQEAVPLTRDYIVDLERSHGGRRSVAA